MDRSDWERLESLADRVGIGVERVVTLRRRLDLDRKRAGGPLTLVVGRGPSGLDLLAERWCGPDLAALLAHAGEQPVVAGPKPQAVIPQFAAWPIHIWNPPIVGHLLFLCTESPPSAQLANLIGALGYVDQVVLVSRLFQAMHADERRILDAFAPLGATARVLLVWFPGEEPSDSDLAEVPIFAWKHADASGFHGRCLQPCIWHPAPGETDRRVVADPARCLEADSAAVAAGRGPMAEVAVVRLLREIRDLARQGESPSVETLPASEADRLGRELSGFLHDLGEELNRVLATRSGYGAEQLRGYARDAIRGWGAYTTIEGHWMKYLETIRPGMQQGLKDCVDASLSCIDVQKPVEAPSANPAPQAPLSASSMGLVERLVLEAKRLGLGLILGILLAAVGPDLVVLPEVADKLVSLALLGVGTVLGYGIALMLLRPAAPGVRRGEQAAAAPVAEVCGWGQFQRRIESWFADRIRGDRSSALEQSEKLAERLGLKIEDRKT